MEIKESIYLLLLQKREEAAINFAVVKPSLKVIDYAISDIYSVYPSSLKTYLLSFLLGMLLPFSILTGIFYFDKKIHTKKQLSSLLDSNIAIVGEVPFTPSNVIENIINSYSRVPFAESIRMLIANLNFMTFEKENRVILVTSSVKGEGKTLISVNLASLLNKKDNKILLIGSDLRNPQIHKYLDVTKDHKGLSDYIFLNNTNFKDFIYESENYDIMLFRYHTS